MSYLRFDRHQKFNSEMMDYHSDTLRAVEDFYMNQNQSWFNDVYNMLCGVWDGYLYQPYRIHNQFHSKINPLYNG